MRGRAVGDVVARGKIRVDARKAAEKLRDHMLVDLHLYACELARAAVVCGAEALHVEWDADDAIFVWSGRPLPHAELARARDHVLTPATDEDGAALRYLGIGVSAALGLDAAFVDVCAGAERIRFTSGKGEPSTEAYEETLAPGTTRVHVRRRVGLATLGRAVSPEAPPEIALLLARVVDAPLRILVNGTEAGRRMRDVLLRIDLDEPSLLRGFLEVHAPGSAAPSRTTLLERGVELVAYTSILGGWDDAEVPLPIRLVVDARSLPTNASRSELRQDADLPRRLHAVVPRVLASTLAALRELGEGRPAPDGMPITIAPGVDTAAIADALGGVVAHVAHASRRGKALPEEARALLSVPLLATAAGAPAAPSSLPSPDAGPLHVYRGSALERELEPWLASVYWDRGRAIDRIYDLYTRVPADTLVQHAQQGFARRRRALEHPAAKTALPPSDAYGLREAFHVESGPFAGLEGELGVLRRGPSYRRSVLARLFVEERLLESIAISAVTLPVDLALSWPGKIRAKYTYDGVERDGAFEQAVLYALRVAASAIAQRYEPRDPELVQLALSAWIGATKTLGDVVPGLSALGPLADAPAWRTADGALVSTRTLFEYAKRTKVLCAGATPLSPDRRPIVRPDDAKRALVLMPPGTEVVAYEAVGDSERALAGQAAKCALVVPFERANVKGFVGLGPSREIVLHAGAVVRDMPRVSAYGAATVVIDDRAAIPKRGHEGAHFSTFVDVAAEEMTLLERFVAGCEGGSIDPAEHAAKIEAAIEVLTKRADEEHEALLVRLRALPEMARRTALELRRASLLAQAPRDLAAPPNGIDPDVPHARRTFAHGESATAWLAPGNGFAEVTFEGRPFLARFPIALPVAVLVDIRRAELVSDVVDQLSHEGEQWVREASAGAATALANVLMRLPRFAANVGALRLVLSLLESSTENSVTLGAALEDVAWPTVQGETVKLSAFPDLVPYGTQAYAQYRRGTPSPFDAPALYISPDDAGMLVRRIVERTSRRLDDVTASIARLQTRRAKGEAAPPRLPGTPEHPRLRATFQELGIVALEGELEIAPPGATEVMTVGPSGALDRVDVAVPYPLRAALRADDDTRLGIARELGRAAAKLARSRGRELSSLPPYARDALRAVVCAASREKKLVAGDAEAPIFVDTRGISRSIADLERAGAFGLTSDPPPYPPHEGLVIHLAPGEQVVFGTAVVIRDATEELRTIARGIARRQAPAEGRIELTAEMRARCIFTFVFTSEGVTGEVGLLAPKHAAERLVHVRTTNRPLCTIEDGPGWPLLAVVNDDKLRPTVGFDAFTEPADGTRLRRVLRAVASHHLPSLLAAGADNIGAMRLPSGFQARVGKKNVPCLAVIWLERKWPEHPGLQIHAIDGDEPFRLPEMPKNPEAKTRVLPVNGRLWVAAKLGEAGPAIEDVLRALAPRVKPLLHAAARAHNKPAAEDLEAYAWDLALLGQGDGRDPAAEAAKTERDPAFVRVAQVRAPGMLLQASIDPSELRLAPSPAPVEPAPATDVDVELPPPSEPFLEGLVRRIIAVFDPSSVAPAAADEDALAAALLAALSALRLTGEPVATVKVVRRGRPVRYDAKRRALLLATKHPSVVALEKKPTRMLHLVAAAVSEINRELVEVTDAEERTVLLDLLGGR